MILYLPDQVVFEFERNRDIVISESYKKFADLKFDQSFPYICKTYPEYEEIRKNIKLIKESKKTLEGKLGEDIKNNSLKADAVVRELFEKAKNIYVPPVYVEKAILRYQRGNPPGKNDSYGDAINWETLLEEVPYGTELVLISDDKDFKSPAENSQLNSFLLKEWEQKKGAKINFYNNLSGFFLENYPEIKLREEETKEALINELAESRNFANTHLIIRKLAQFGGFSPYHIRQLINIAISNNQVYWIADDPDINAFYRDLIKGKEGLVDEDTYAHFSHYFMKDNEIDHNDEKIDPDDIPF